MIKLLASVTGPDEAEVALFGGADIIDLKDPSRGALGAVSPEVLAATIARVAGRRPVSAVAGDLPMEIGPVRDAVTARRAADFVKIGLFPAPIEAQRAVIAGLADLAATVPLVAVFFADGAPEFSLLDEMKAAGFRGAMIDTMVKGQAGGGLLRHLPLTELRRFVERARALGLVSGLAGSLEPPDVPRLGVLKPDYLGFRSALTAGRREDAIDAGAVASIRALIDAEGAGGAGPSVHVAGGETDLIFVRDFALDMEIGAYGFERGRVQKVRFGIEAEIYRRVQGPGDLPGGRGTGALPGGRGTGALPGGRGTGGLPGGMTDIYSYDLIMDAVRELVARGHTDLVETLAEELAATVLADGRVKNVVVRVEKLELGPGAVGVEIRRARAS